MNTRNDRNDVIGSTDRRIATRIDRAFESINGFKKQSTNNNFDNEDVERVSSNNVGNKTPVLLALPFIVIHYVISIVLFVCYGVYDKNYSHNILIINIICQSLATIGAIFLYDVSNIQSSTKNIFAS